MSVRDLNSAWAPAVNKTAAYSNYSSFLSSLGISLMKFRQSKLITQSFRNLIIVLELLLKQQYKKKIYIHTTLNLLQEPQRGFLLSSVYRLFCETGLATSCGPDLFRRSAPVCCRVGPRQI